MLIIQEDTIQHLGSLFVELVESGLSLLNSLFDGLLEVFTSLFGIRRESGSNTTGNQHSEVEESLVATMFDRALIVGASVHFVSSLVDSVLVGTGVDELIVTETIESALLGLFELFFGQIVRTARTKGLNAF